MDYNDIQSLKDNGFSGFKTVQELWLDSTVIPAERGVYLVLDINEKLPEFLFPGVGGFFKNRDPNVTEDVLKSKWIEDSRVVYIGKAGSLTGQATLRSRLRQYLRFGQSKKVGHWGGRLIWQLAHYADLIFCWKPTPEHEPRTVEVQLLADYKNQFERLPFANLTN
ncbi:MAG: hypothetical protein WD509_02695 [Candidatus Paceibacterota bacterium]